ncbi:CDP-alcohol phosphatidyltransferase family protein [Salinisphaera sp. SPP-AMP-43]|uniref:CDP-alcohol phosphatidyltransferase family protein n=1 Tax=Salinisphaera sp. SPP-AMP-43 TaxID=3121288 RepID=UPI003C6E6AE4
MKPHWPHIGHGRPPQLIADALIAMLATSAGVLAVAASITLIGQASPAFVIAAPLGFGLIAAVVIFNLPAHPYPRFGMANCVTTARAGLTALIGALAFEADQLGTHAPTLAWLATGTAATALSLDGLDGYAARHRAEASRFGARFDMEIDALLILLLCVLLHGSGKLGSWVYALGLMRYVFVVAQWLWPRLADTPLPPSQRRKIVCVIQGLVLCTGLAPSVDASVASALAAGGLLALTGSFALDMHYLIASSRR